MRVLRALLMTLAASCGPGAPEGACVDDGDCAGLAVCTATSECVDVECLSSAQCTLDAHCDDATHACLLGCEAEDDCFPGDTCDATTGTCVPAACVDTQLDCSLGEQCDTASGVCDPAPDLCARCEGDVWTRCTDTLGGECRWFRDAAFCVLPCDPNTPPSEVPRGFTCLNVSSTAERYRLWGDCAAVDDLRAAP